MSRPRRPRGGGDTSTGGAGSGETPTGGAGGRDVPTGGTAGARPAGRQRGPTSAQSVGQGQQSVGESARLGRPDPGASFGGGTVPGTPPSGSATDPALAGTTANPAGPATSGVPGAASPPPGPGGPPAGSPTDIPDWRQRMDAALGGGGNPPGLAGTPGASGAGASAGAGGTDGGGSGGRGTGGGGTPPGDGPGGGPGDGDGPGSGDGSEDPYRPADRTDQELQDDLDPTPRDGETPEQAADRADAAATELEVRRYIETYEQLGDEPPRFDVASNDARYGHVTGREHPHTDERHGPDVRLERDPTGTGRTIEGRIYGDPPWGNQATYSFRWDNPSVQNRAINEYVNQHWDNIRHDLARSGEHSATFDFGNRVGEGYYNDGAYGVGPRRAHHHVTSYFEVRINIVPGSNPPEPYIVSAFPSANP